MATMQKDGKPLDDLSYDLIAILHEKSQALAAYDKYVTDAKGDKEALECIEQIRKDDEEHIQKLRTIVARCLGQSGGKQGSMAV